MTLHAGLANPTCLKSFMVSYGSVCELHCLNSEGEDEEFLGLWENRHILFNPFPMHEFVSGVI